MDCLDLRKSEFVSLPFQDVVAKGADFPLDLYISRTDQEFPLVSFDRLLSHTPVARDLRRMLDVLETAYEHPVDIEFTINFLADDSYRIHLLQCRTFQVRREIAATTHLPHATGRTLLAAHGAVIGVSREALLSRIVYIVTSRYAQLTEQGRYAVARLIGDINKKHPVEDRGLMLIGPGRWGTHSPSLGIPVSFTEISRASVVCEVVAMHERLVPDVSLGTHFFNDLVEHDMLYVAYFPTKAGNSIDEDWFINAPNKLLELEPDAKGMADVVRVIDCNDHEHPVWLRADTTAQEALVITRTPQS